LSGSGDDYDWAVFDLTNANCDDIYLNPSLQISCNSWGSLTALNGLTGASSAHGGTTNSNGPGDTNGPPWNADIPVVAGGTYVIMIDNWSSSQYGYSIDFSSSTAQIYDNVPPHISQVHTPIICGATSITIDFSENILCNTVQTGDFTLTGPGGPYTITGVTGSACSAGGTQENTFTISISPSIVTGGTYNINLVTTSGSVTDLCGNVAPVGSLPFNVSVVSANISAFTDATCGVGNGTATVTATGGSGVYGYQWNTSPAQTTSTASGLGPGTYIVTVTNGSCQARDTVTIGNVGGLSASITTVIADTCNKNVGSATVSVSAGSTPYNYNWNTSPPQTSATVGNLSGGTYQVTVTDADNCTTILSTIVNEIPGPTLNMAASNETCMQSNGSATVDATGGAGNYTYVWSTNPTQTTPVATGLSSGTYTVTVFDGQCYETGITNISNLSDVYAGFIIQPPIVTLYDHDAVVSFTDNSIGATSWSWDFGDGANGVGNYITHGYQNTGYYMVVLTAANDNNCIDTAIHYVWVKDYYTMYIPNSFTPDGDGLNDVFGPIGVNIDLSNFEMSIYDRWGKQIYHTRDISKPWDGTVFNSGIRSKAYIGVYAYHIYAQEHKGEPIEYLGRVTLIR
jgi:gliding motility-associated-like protein